MMEWKIRSSSGRNDVSVKFFNQYKKLDGEIFLIGNIEITGFFWTRFKNIHEEGDIKDFSVTLSQIGFWYDQLNEFLIKLKKWMDQPHDFYIQFSCDLHGDQEITITIGKNEEIISSDQKPACIVEYSCGSFRYGKWMFVVDYSCINMMVEEIEGVLQESNSLPVI